MENKERGLKTRIQNHSRMFGVIQSPKFSLQLNIEVFHIAYLIPI